MDTIRPAAVAGMFYTDDATELRTQVQHFLSEARPAEHVPKAIIAPHAGYAYSGPIAGSAYAPLLARADQIHRVVLLGPAHRVYVKGIAASIASIFETPLGNVTIDQVTIRTLIAEFDFLFYDDSVHEQEHSLEVQLPFLQTVLHDFQLLPFAVGEAEPAQVEQLLERLWGGPETLIVISSDLSHYHDYATAQRLDSFTSDRIVNLDPAVLTSDNACGQIPVRGLLRCAVHHHLDCELVDLRNSADVAGGRGRVVGYGAYIFFPAEPVFTLTSEERRRLTEIARESVAYGLQHGRALPVDLQQWPEALQADRAAFVTIKLNGELRGCIGTLQAHRSLVVDIAENAYLAAFCDPRFSPLTETDLANAEFHLSLLSQPDPITFGSEAELLDQLRPGIDGLVLADGNRRGTFLPTVWESLPERHAFLQQLKRKAGLPPDHWSDTIQVSRYTTESW